MSSKFVKNSDNAMIVCRVTSDKNKVFHFSQKKFDKKNNMMLSNGFTEISDEDIALLEAESSVFKYYTAKGLLSVTDILPHEAMSTDQLMSALKAENAMLKKELKIAREGNSGSSLDKEQIAYRDEEIARLKKKIAEQEKTIEALDEQLAFAAEENNTEKDGE